MQINSSEFRNAAGIAEYNSGVIEDCISRVNMNSYGVNIRMAGITAYNDGDIYRCKNEGNLSGKASELAGIAALNGGTNIVGCENSGAISFQTSGCHAYAGGIVGNEYRASSGSQFTIEDCKNTGDIYGDVENGAATIGGVIGETTRKGDNSNSTIKNCTNAGNLYGTGEIGGVIGAVNHGHTYTLNGEEIVSNGDNFLVEGCGNSGTITVKKGVDGTSSWAGGVFGKVNIAKNGTVYIKDCGNSGSIYSENGKSDRNVDVLGGIGASLENVGCADGTANSYIYIESCFNKGFVDDSVNYCSDQIGGISGGNTAVTNCNYTGNRFQTDADGNVHAYYPDGTPIRNQFIFDGYFTYYIQADGTAMKDNLTYHPDGTHIICFDNKGHEVFMDFYYCSKVGYTCYFDSLGYIYKDQITFVGNKTYYLNGDGKMENSGWFRFANGRDYGYANSDGTLKTNQFSYDAWGRVVFYHWNGMVARGLISDGLWYYSMDTGDGHYLGRFKAAGVAASDTYQFQVLDLVNEERLSRNIPPLKVSEQAQQAAQIRAGEIYTLFSHTRPNGTSCLTVLDEYVTDGYMSAGENIAAGQSSPQEVVEDWMNSPGHRANILDESYTALGVGYYYNSSGLYCSYWVQLFIGDEY